MSQNRAGGQLRHRCERFRQFPGLISEGINWIVRRFFWAAKKNIGKNTSGSSITISAVSCFCCPVGNYVIQIQPANCGGERPLELAAQKCLHMGILPTERPSCGSQHPVINQTSLNKKHAVINQPKDQRDLFTNGLFVRSLLWSLAPEVFCC